MKHERVTLPYPNSRVFLRGQLSRDNELLPKNRQKCRVGTLSPPYPSVAGFKVPVKLNLGKVPLLHTSGFIQKDDRIPNAKGRITRRDIRRKNERHWRFRARPRAPAKVTPAQARNRRRLSFVAGLLEIVSPLLYDKGSSSTGRAIAWWVRYWPRS